MEDMVNVAVYGTLRRGGALHGHVENSEFVGRGILTGWTLYDLGPYPAIRPGWSWEKVVVEVYRVDRETLEQLDAVEGVAFGLYFRETAAIELDSGQAVEAEVYAMTPGSFMGWVQRKAGTENPVQSLDEGDWILRR